MKIILKKKISRDQAIAKTLVFIKNYLIQNGLNLSNISGLPSLDYSLLEEGQQNTLISDEQNYDQDEINETLNNRDNLNTDQRLIFETIIKAINGEIEQKLFFVDGPGGTGKTYLYNMILAYVRSTNGLNGIAIAVASSGIAALLMSGGRTAHSRFKIPLNLTKNTTLNIKKQSELADLIRKTKVILWDEAPMMNKFAFEAVDKSFKDLMDSTEPFGGKIIVLGGDFRQILPVVIRGNQAQIVDACLKSSNLWKHFQTMKLTINMRIQQQDDVEQKNFVDFLLQVGEGKIPVDSDIGEDFIRLPDEIVLDTENLDNLISEVFNDINLYYQDSDYIKQRAILSTRNDDVDYINEHILNKLPGSDEDNK